MQLAPIFDFLADLTDHNERTWFQAHKATYEQLRTRFEADAEALFRELGRHDPALAGPLGRKSVFRIYRDVRFSKNKDPYKTHFSAYFTVNAGKGVEVPGYYLQLGPHGQTLIAGGLYQPDKTQLAAIRQEIDYTATELNGLLRAPDFHHYFGSMGGDRLKKAPAGFPTDHPEIELLKHKGFLATHELTDAEALGQADFSTYALGVFEAMVPFAQFLRGAVA